MSHLPWSAPGRWPGCPQRWPRRRSGEYLWEQLRKSSSHSTGATIPSLLPLFSPFCFMDSSLEALPPFPAHPPCPAWLDTHVCPQHLSAEGTGPEGCHPITGAGWDLLLPPEAPQPLVFHPSSPEMQISASFSLHADFSLIFPSRRIQPHFPLLFKSTTSGAAGNGSF